MCIRQRIGGSNPPLTAIFKTRARAKVRAFFFYSLRKGGMRIPDRGSTTGDSQLDRLRAQRTGCPKGERSESIPPSPPYSRQELVRKYGLFSFIFSVRRFAPCVLYVGWRYAYPTYKKLVFNHLCILFGEKIHQRPDRWQQAAPGWIHRVDHFPSGFPGIQHPNKFT